MAELVGGAFLGAVVGELLTDLLNAIKNFAQRHESLLRLQGRLERLKPAVEALEFVETDNAHPAGIWLRELHQQLRDAHDLVSTSGGNVKRMLQSGNLERMNDSISELLTDSIPVQLGEQQELRRQLARALEAPSPQVSEKEIKLTTSQLDRHRNVDGGSSSSTSSSAWNSNPSWNKACDIPDPTRISFGGTDMADKLIKGILHGEYTKWIVLWGMGGVGKTFTANRVYHDPSIARHFRGGTYWVTVSKDQPSPQHILKLLCTRIKGGTPTKFPDGLEDARSTVRGLLQRERILLVLDDVWQPSTLECLDVVSKNRKGVILITTRDKGSLKKCVSRDEEYLERIVDVAKIVEIPRLTPEHSLQLFSWHAFGCYRKSVPPDLQSLVKDVADECKGLPLALQVIGSVMGLINVDSSDMMLGRSLSREWEQALEQLRNASRYEDDYEDLYQKLQWSVDNLVDKDPRLKDCFFYFAAYPEDFPVPVEEVVSVWAAEGLCGREEGKRLLKFLIEKSVIELIDGGICCKIHDVMRDLVHRNLKFDRKQEIYVSRRKCLYSPGLTLDSFPHDWATRGIQLSAQRLSIRNNNLQELPGQFNAPNLRVLMLGKNPIGTLPPRFFQSLSYLRVLVLSWTEIEKLSGSVLQNLKSLVLLDLTMCMSLRKISNKLDTLQNLETVLLYGCEDLQKLPRMKNLKKLHTISVFLPIPESQADLVAGTRLGNKFGIHEVLHMSSLRRLRIFGAGWYVPDVSSQHKVEELTLDNVPGAPAGLMDLHHLKVLHIENSDLVADLPLEKLPVLEELSIKSCENIYFLPESFGHAGSFPSLRKLSVCGLCELRKLFTICAGAMPKIEILLLAEFSNFEEFPVSLTSLKSLKCLCLGENRFREEDLNALFSQPDCFPKLEVLVVERSLRPMLPQHLLDRESLKIEVVTLRNFQQRIGF